MKVEVPCRVVVGQGELQNGLEMVLVDHDLVVVGGDHVVGVGNHPRHHRRIGMGSGVGLDHVVVTHNRLRRRNVLVSVHDRSWCDLFNGDKRG